MLLHYVLSTSTSNESGQSPHWVTFEQFLLGNNDFNSDVASYWKGLFRYDACVSHIKPVQSTSNTCTALHPYVGVM